MSKMENKVNPIFWLTIILKAVSFFIKKQKNVPKKQGDTVIL